MSWHSLTYELTFYPELLRKWIFLSYHTYEWVMSNVWKSHVTHMNESCHTYECVMSHIRTSHGTHTPVARVHNGPPLTSAEADCLVVPLCNTLQHTATHCNTLQHTATHCSTLQHTITHNNTQQHTITQCTTLQHTRMSTCAASWHYTTPNRCDSGSSCRSRQYWHDHPCASLRSSPPLTRRLPTVAWIYKYVYKDKRTEKQRARERERHLYARRNRETWMPSSSDSL